VQNAILFYFNFYMVFDVQRKTLLLRDIEKELMCLWSTHGRTVLKEQIQLLPSLVNALFPLELFEDDSTRVGFEFCAVHMSQYNRYTESVSHFYFLSNLNPVHFDIQGIGAPSDIHPNRLWKEKAFRVNHTQRAPYVAKAISEDPIRYNLLKEVLMDIFEFVRQNVKKVFLFV
jgi:hypothetical protein